MIINISDIKKEQVFWEKNHQFTATEDAFMLGTINLPNNPNAKQWKVEAIRNEDNEEFDFMETEGATHYGPRLSSSNEEFDMSDPFSAFPRAY